MASSTPDRQVAIDRVVTVLMTVAAIAVGVAAARHVDPPMGGLRITGVVVIIAGVVVAHALYPPRRPASEAPRVSQGDGPTKPWDDDDGLTIRPGWQLVRALMLLPLAFDAVGSRTPRVLPELVPIRGVIVRTQVLSGIRGTSVATMVLRAPEFDADTATVSLGYPMRDWLPDTSRIHRSLPDGDTVSIRASRSPWPRPWGAWELIRGRDTLIRLDESLAEWRDGYDPADDSGVDMLFTIPVALGLMVAAFFKWSGSLVRDGARSRAELPHHSGD